MIISEDTRIKVGNIMLPGLFKSMEITEDAEIEEQKVEGSSVAKKQAMGYEDAKINIELTLEDGIFESKYYKLRKIQNIFRKPGQKKPTVYNITNDQLAARNVGNVLFKSMSSKQDNGKSSITATLTFWVYDAMKITAAVVPMKPIYETMEIDVAKRDLACQVGMAPKLSTLSKTAKSPACDDADATQLIRKVRRK